MKKFTWAFRVTLTIGLISGLFVGCGCREKVTQKVAEKAIEKAIAADAKKDGKDVNVDLNLKDGKMSVKSKDGKDDVDIAMKDGKMSIKSKDGESNVSVDGDNGTFTTKTAEGTFTTTTGKNAKVPDNFPKDLPVYAGAEITMASSATQNEMFNLQLVTADTLDKVAEYYKKELPAKGWKEENTMSQSGDSPMHMLTYTKEERTAMVMITKDDNKTQITLQTSKK